VNKTPLFTCPENVRRIPVFALATALPLSWAKPGALLTANALADANRNDLMSVLDFDVVRNWNNNRLGRRCIS
jgi:hypothetical protein